MKKTVFLACIIIFTAAFCLTDIECFAYSSYSGSSSYSSAASTSARYNAARSSYSSSYSGARNSSYGSYHSSYGATSASYSRPASRNSSSSMYGSNYGSSYARQRSSSNYFPTPSSNFNSVSASYRAKSSDSGVKVVPFRYNTLDYTRVRKMEADPPKEFSAKCTDRGDASFCN